MFTHYAEVKAFLRHGTLMKACVQACKGLMHLWQKGGVNLKLYPDVLFIHRPSWLVVAMIRRIWTTNKSMQRYNVHTVSTGGLLETRMDYDAMLCTANKPDMELPVLKGLEKFFKANRN